MFVLFPPFLFPPSPLFLLVLLLLLLLLPLLLPPPLNTPTIPAIANTTLPLFADLADPATKEPYACIYIRQLAHSVRGRGMTSERAGCVSVFAFVFFSLSLSLSLSPLRLLVLLLEPRQVEWATRMAMVTLQCMCFAAMAMEGCVPACLPLARCAIRYQRSPLHYAMLVGPEPGDDVLLIV